MLQPELLSIEMSDGYTAHAEYWTAPAGSPAVLHIHGIQSHCGWYTDTCRAINAAGFAVLQVDRRGCGRNESARGHAESHQQLIDDGVTAAQVLLDRSGATRVHLVGVSWGGKLVAAMHALHPQRTASLTLIAPGLFPIIDVSNAEKFRIGWSMVAHPDKLYDIPLNDAELFTDNPERIDYIANDPLALHQATAGFLFGVAANGQSLPQAGRRSTGPCAPDARGRRADHRQRPHAEIRGRVALAAPASELLRECPAHHRVWRGPRSVRCGPNWIFARSRRGIGVDSGGHH
jgi:alpha-beta hydrolase superfamily lysophospholipase